VAVERILKCLAGLVARQPVSVRGVKDGEQRRVLGPASMLPDELVDFSSDVALAGDR
jgi:hypothetical protein